MIINREEGEKRGEGEGGRYRINREEGGNMRERERYYWYNRKDTRGVAIERVYTLYKGDKNIITKGG